MKKIIFCLIISILLYGCLSTSSYEIKQEPSKLTVFSYDATRRGTYIVTDSNGKTNIISEPSPDVAKEITSSLGLSAKTIEEITDADLKIKYASKIIDLASRSQTLQMLRESLFRLSEIGTNSNLTKDDRVELFKMIIDTMKMIAIVEMENSGMDKQTLKTVVDRLAPEQKGKPSNN